MKSRERGKKALEFPATTPARTVSIESADRITEYKSEKHHLKNVFMSHNLFTFLIGITDFYDQH